MFNESKEQIEMNENNFDAVVPKGSQVICVLELVYLSITTKVSAKWKLVQAKVYKNQQSITGYAMIDDESQQEDLDTENDIVEATKAISLDESKEELEEEKEVVEVVEEEEEVVEEEEDVVEEESEEVEQEPLPPPKVTKPRAKRGVAA
jgi:hypothetical protein